MKNRNIFLQVDPCRLQKHVGHIAKKYFNEINYFLTNSEISTKLGSYFRNIKTFAWNLAHNTAIDQINLNQITNA